VGEEQLLMATGGDDYLYGTTGADSISGQAGNDVIYGYANGSVPLSEDGPDQLYGDDGNDTIYGGTGNDVIYGGDGDDVLSAGPDKTYLGDYDFGTGPGQGGAGAPSDYIYGGAGDDTLLVRYKGIVNLATSEALGISCVIDNGTVQVTIDGIYKGEYATSIERLELTSGDKADTVTGTNGDDILDTGAGDDIIKTLAGDDIVTKSSGMLSIDGGDDIDRLNLDRSADTAKVSFFGSTGSLFVGGASSGSALNFENFQVSGGSADDTLTGSNAGWNLLAGNGGNDTLIGGSNADTLIGSAGNDYLAGHEGADSITGGEGIDKIDAGDGDDEVYMNLIDDVEVGETYIGGTGTDTLHIDFYGIGSTFDLSKVTITGFETIDPVGYNLTPYAVKMTVAQITQFEEIILGSSVYNKITIQLTDNTKVDFGGEALSFYRLQLADGGQTADFRGATADSFAVNTMPEVLGGRGDDIIYGRNEANRIFIASGGLGNDTFIGGASGSTFNGGGGNDKMTGGSSVSDTVSFAGATTKVTVDLSIIKAQNTGQGTDTITGFENASGGDHDDRLLGSSVKNVLSGGLGNDFLQGGAGADMLYGGGGLDTASYQGSKAGVMVTLGSFGFTVATGGDAQGDTGSQIENLLGSSKNDVLSGNTFANVLDGGAGKDKLTGDQGADDFMFDTALNARTNVDTITDFEHGIDDISLSKKLFDVFGTKVDTAELRLGTVAKDRNDFLIYDKKTGDLFYDADGSGKGHAIQFAELSGHVTLNAGDFMLF
jgi:Ca2+-binding RTX toxin-like protein